MKSYSNIHDISDIVGSFKKWQILIFCATIYFELVSVHIANVTMFIVPANLEYWCREPYVQKGSIYVAENDEQQEEVNSACSYNVNSTIAKCTAWSYDRKTYSSSFVEKWDLVCDKGWLVSFSMSVTIFGDLIGCLVFGYLADKWGRRKTMLAALVPAMVGSVGTFFAPEIVSFLICRFLCGASGLGFITCSFVLLMEVVGQPVRSATGNTIKVGMTFGALLLGGCGYFLRYWEFIMIASTVPLFFMLVICWFLPESPRWLLMNNRVKEAKEILIKAARMNGLETPETENQILYLAEQMKKDNCESSIRVPTIWDLFKTRNLRIKTIIMMTLWLISGFESHSLLMNITLFGQDNFAGPLLVICAEFPGNLVGYFAFQKYGSKWTNQISWILLAIVTGAIALAGNNGYWSLMISLSVMKVMTMTPSNGLYIQSAEIFPTVARTIGLGSCSIFARVSAMVTPFFKELCLKVGFSYAFSLLSALSLVASVLALFLPNTHDTRLPETLEDAEHVALYIPSFKRLQYYKLVNKEDNVK